MPPLPPSSPLRMAPAWVAALALAAAACGPAPFVPPDGHWNVLVLAPDTIRADHLSLNGYERETSPALDALAREGVNFGLAVSTAPRTWQSFASLLTGLYPPRHGVRYVLDDPLEPDTPTVASILGEIGYETASFDPMLVLASLTRFQHFAENVGAQEEPGRADALLVEKLETYLARERTHPFFAFVRLNGAHWPYTKGSPDGRFEPCRDHSHDFNLPRRSVVSAGEGLGMKVANPDGYRALIWADDPDEEARAHRVAHYDAEIAHVDTLLGRVFARLRELDLLEKTIVVVTSDHGESFFEHGYMQHGPRVDDVVMLVPLVIRLPRGHPAHAEGLVVDALVRTVDLAPTLLAAVGAPVPEGLDGRSLLPLVRGESMPERWAYGESGRSFMGMDPERYRPKVAGKRRMVRTRDWKLVHVPGDEAGPDRLYDLRSDPGENEDVAARHPEQVARLRALLDPILRADTPSEEERELSPAEIELLRELGYMQ